MADVAQQPSLEALDPQGAGSSLSAGMPRVADMRDPEGFEEGNDSAGRAPPPMMKQPVAAPALPSRPVRAAAVGGDVSESQRDKVREEFEEMLTTRVPKEELDAAKAKRLAGELEKALFERAKGGGRIYRSARIQIYSAFKNPFHGLSLLKSLVNNEAEFPADRFMECFAHPDKSKQNALFDALVQGASSSRPTAAPPSNPQQGPPPPNALHRAPANPSPVQSAPIVPPAPPAPLSAAPPTTSPAEPPPPAPSAQQHPFRAAPPQVPPLGPPAAHRGPQGPPPPPLHPSATAKPYELPPSASPPAASLVRGPLPPTPPEAETFDEVPSAGANIRPHGQGQHIPADQYAPPAPPSSDLHPTLVVAEPPPPEPPLAQDSQQQNSELPYPPPAGASGAPIYPLTQHRRSSTASAAFPQPPPTSTTITNPVQAPLGPPPANTLSYSSSSESVNGTPAAPPEPFQRAPSNLRPIAIGQSNPQPHQAPFAPGGASERNSLPPLQAPAMGFGPAQRSASVSSSTHNRAATMGLLLHHHADTPSSGRRYDATSPRIPTSRFLSAVAEDKVALYPSAETKTRVVSVLEDAVPSRKLTTDGNVSEHGGARSDRNISPSGASGSGPEGGLDGDTTDNASDSAEKAERVEMETRKLVLPCPEGLSEVAIRRMMKEELKDAALDAAEQNREYLEERVKSMEEKICTAVKFQVEGATLQLAQIMGTAFLELQAKMESLSSNVAVAAATAAAMHAPAASVGEASPPVGGDGLMDEEMKRRLSDRRRHNNFSSLAADESTDGRQACGVDDVEGELADENGEAGSRRPAMEEALGRVVALVEGSSGGSQLEDHLKDLKKMFERTFLRETIDTTSKPASPFSPDFAQFSEESRRAAADSSSNQPTIESEDVEPSLASSTQRNGTEPSPAPVLAAAAESGSHDPPRQDSPPIDRPVSVNHSDFSSRGSPLGSWRQRRGGSNQRAVGEWFDSLTGLRSDPARGSETKSPPPRSPSPSHRESQHEERLSQQLSPAPPPAQQSSMLHQQALQPPPQALHQQHQPPHSPVGELEGWAAHAAPAATATATVSESSHQPQQPQQRPLSAAAEEAVPDWFHGGCAGNAGVQGQTPNRLAQPIEQVSRPITPLDNWSAELATGGHVQKPPTQSQNSSGLGSTHLGAWYEQRRPVEELGAPHGSQQVGGLGDWFGDSGGSSVVGSVGTQGGQTSATMIGQQSNWMGEAAVGDQYRQPDHHHLYHQEQQQHPPELAGNHQHFDPQRPHPLHHNRPQPYDGDDQQQQNSHLHHLGQQQQQPLPFAPPPHHQPQFDRQHQHHPHHQLHHAQQIEAGSDWFESQMAGAGGNDESRGPTAALHQQHAAASWGWNTAAAPAANLPSSAKAENSNDSPFQNWQPRIAGAEGTARALHSPF